MQFSWLVTESELSVPNLRGFNFRNNFQDLTLQNNSAKWFVIQGGGSKQDHECDVHFEERRRDDQGEMQFSWSVGFVGANLLQSTQFDYWTMRYHLSFHTTSTLRSLLMHISETSQLFLRPWHWQLPLWPGASNEGIFCAAVANTILFHQSTAVACCWTLDFARTSILINLTTPILHA